MCPTSIKCIGDDNNPVVARLPHKSHLSLELFDNSAASPTFYESPYDVSKYDFFDLFCIIALRAIIQTTVTMLNVHVNFEAIRMRHCGEQAVTQKVVNKNLDYASLHQDNAR